MPRVKDVRRRSAKLDSAYDAKPKLRREIKKYNWTPARINVNTHAQVKWQMGSLQQAINVLHRMGYGVSAQIIKSTMETILYLEDQRYEREKLRLKGGA